MSISPVKPSQLRALLAKTIPAKLTILITGAPGIGKTDCEAQACAMQLILGRQIDGHRVSDEVVFIAATNRRGDRAGVSGILEPVKSRFATIVELVPDLNDWCVWAASTDIAPEVIAFLRFRPELFSYFKPTADLTNSPSPRTW